MIHSKDKNAITNALTAVYGQMFPGGKQEECILTTELYELLGGRIHTKVINQALCCVLSSIVLFGVKRKVQLMDMLNNRFGKKLTKDDLTIIMEFAITRNNIVSMLITP